MTDETKLEQQLRDLGAAVTPRASFTDEVMREVRRDQVEHKTMESRTNFSRLARVAAGVLLIGGLLAGGLWLAIGSSTSVALADVSEFLEQAGTICFRMTIERPGDATIEYDIQCLRPGLMRMEVPEGVSIIDWNEGEFLALFPEAKQAHTAKVEGMENPYYKDWLADLKRIIGSDKAEEAGQDRIDGHSVKGWSVDDEGWLTTVWADAETAKLVQVEFERDRTRMTMSDFEFGRELDEADFSLKPPTEYTFQTRSEMKASDLSEADVIIVLRIWASGNGDIFPDNLNPWQFHKAASKADWSQFRDMFKSNAEASSAISRGFMFLNMKPGWQYAGKGVAVGDATSPVFWYRPKDATKYRVIHGDFSVKALTEAELPK